MKVISGENTIHQMTRKSDSLIFTHIIFLIIYLTEDGHGKTQEKQEQKTEVNERGKQKLEQLRIPSSYSVSNLTFMHEG